MASTKRRTKHRGNAAGMVEARGRTGRKPTAGERTPATKGRTSRPNRFDSPPTWRSAVNRALIATALFVVVVILAFGQNALAAVTLGCFMLLLYIPLGYYTDLFLYNKRQKSLAKARQR
jgi:hypothetical protein